MLSINDISFSYNKTLVLKNINFSLRPGEHLAIMGESGCGKSTLLKAIYGLLDLNKGAIFHNQIELLGPEHHLVPGHSFMKYLTQELNVMPYTSVADNVGEFLSRFYPKEKEQRTQELLNIVGLTEYYHTHVRYLSGGQKQRVALAKVLAKEPKVLLLDEPFSQIDHFRKNDLRYQLFEYLKQEKITCITATHDSNDVLPFANNILVMKNGEQCILDTPKRIYQKTTDVYTASLLSEINVLSEKKLNISSSTKPIILYPHQIYIKDNGKFSGIVKTCYFKGSFYMLRISFESETLLLESKIPYNKEDIILFEINLK